MKKILVLSFMLFFCGSAVFAASRTADIVNTALAVKDVKTLHKAIIKGCEERGWIPVKTGDNEITATLDTRGHQVIVKITYNNNGYRITHKDSKNMSYNPQKNTIHPKYNQWTANLDRSIKTNVNFRKDME
ncbi:MAG: hypothetical protein FWH43_01970 [Endomicrobia bacterium]|nr:hypothetical protein [Endomicrobiia bacterium]